MARHEARGRRLGCCIELCAPVGWGQGLARAGFGSGRPSKVTSDVHARGRGGRARLQAAMRDLRYWQARSGNHSATPTRRWSTNDCDLDNNADGAACGAHGERRGESGTRRCATSPASPPRPTSIAIGSIPSRSPFAWLARNGTHDTGSSYPSRGDVALGNPSSCARVRRRARPRAFADTRGGGRVYGERRRPRLGVSASLESEGAVPVMERRTIRRGTHRPEEQDFARLPGGIRLPVPNLEAILHKRD